MTRIFLSPPHLGEDERALVQEAFDTNWIAPLGPHVDGFEKELADYVGVKSAAALSSGTAGLHLAHRLLGIGPGDRVLCPTLNFIASVSPVVQSGAEPIFLDSESKSWNLDPDLLEEELEESDREGVLPKAVLSVDLYGQCADYDRIVAICDRFGVQIIEDAAEALGATYNGRPAGNFGKIGIFSFNGNKIITTGGGGMLVSDDEELVAEARFLSTQARDPGPHYQHSRLGYNYRLSNVLAAIGRGQLRVLDDRVAARRKNFEYYRDHLGALPGILFMPEAPWGRSTRWLTCLTLDPEAFGADRDKVRLALEAEDIEARPVWKPMHLQPVFSENRCRGGQVAEALFERGLCLPSGSSLQESDLQRICSIVRRAGGHPAS